MPPEYTAEELAKRGPQGALAAAAEEQRLRDEASKGDVKPGGVPAHYDENGNWVQGTLEAQPGGRFDQEAAAAAAKAKAQADQTAAERAALDYYRQKSAGVESRNVAGDADIKAGRGAIYQGMNTDNAQSLGLLRGAAEGNAPSFAAVQQRMGLANAIQAGAGAAAGAGPNQFARMGATLGGATQAGQLATNTVQQGGLGRAQEMAQALGQYGAGTEARTSQFQGLRNQEIDMAMKQREQNDRAASAWEKLYGQGSQQAATMSLEERKWREAKANNANLRDFNQSVAGLGAGAAGAGAIFQYAQGFGAPEPVTQQGGTDGYGGKGEYKIYDDNGNVIPSDVRIKKDIVTPSKAHLLSQWRAR